MSNIYQLGRSCSYAKMHDRGAVANETVVFTVAEDRTLHPWFTMRYRLFSSTLGLHRHASLHHLNLLYAIITHVSTFSNAYILPNISCFIQSACYAKNFGSTLGKRKGADHLTLAPAFKGRVHIQRTSSVPAFSTARTSCLKSVWPCCNHHSDCQNALHLVHLTT